MKTIVTQDLDYIVELKRQNDPMLWCGTGPWNDEPDKMQWKDPATGLPCLIVRNQMGALCGYVGVSKGNRYYQKDYANLDDVNVHGGLTYSGKGTPQVRCELEDDDDHRLWWLGFDTAHAGDLVPGIPFTQRSGDQYRDLEYVKKECERLAAQLALP